MLFNGESCNFNIQIRRQNVFIKSMIKVENIEPNVDGATQHLKNKMHDREDHQKNLINDENAVRFTDIIRLKTITWIHLVVIIFLVY
ncbi:uncharacterized protein PHALS_15157 [Plasmopara halstedii]|uniref:Uncharacterized protein n=1 Tax=Plasmopara halstedii TaxID=4781 RepID=A0A0P1B3B8_PLAHL|nr:uncharacterized protein PHALS_15157 [Plasmopara halstedii]CEG48569.1 hypothetical protein PHALS_15157 [Plasmopara halstedii]|eukprot:XP_024584938.1 hypothetical protein PHALS_15157 [Plasmopara halstedii]